MKRAELEGFMPYIGTPLVISFVEMARSLGYSTEIGWDFWDFYLYEHQDRASMVVKTMQNHVTSDQLSRIMVEKTPLKVLLIDGARPKFKELEGQKLFLAATGTGVYVRNVGWLTYPSSPVLETVEDLQLKLAPRWNLDSDGIWRKTCTGCGVRKEQKDFYKAASRTARDPYRNQCVSCFSEKVKVTNNARRQRK